MKMGVICGESWKEQVNVNETFGNFTKHMETGNGDVLISGISVVTAFVAVDTMLTIMNSKIKDILEKALKATQIYRIIALTILILSAPIIVVTFLIAFIYKQIYVARIKLNDEHFVELLSSFDVFWSLEDVVNSVINVVGVIESTNLEVTVKKMRRTVKDLTQKEEVRKIFYRRKEKYGFFYWIINENVDIEQYVTVVVLSKSKNKKVSDLELTMSEVSKNALPYDNEGLFQILITDKRIGNYDKRIGNYDKRNGEYGLIFRVHHSVGDGVALIDLLCKNLADIKQSRPICFTPTPRFESSCKAKINISEIIKKSFESLLCFVDAVCRQPDCNSLHGPNLKGTKIFKWTDQDENLLSAIKDIKNCNEGITSTDILAVALSGGLEEYFAKTMLHIPKEVAVVLPIRLPKPLHSDGIVKLENDFSVSILDLPINGRDKMLNVMRRVDELRTSVYPITNYYFIKIICNTFPKIILQNILKSNQPTLVFSNLPGPDALSICGGNAVKKLLFFIPHRGNTGLGITSFSYGGVLRFSAMVDTSIISNHEDLEIILNGMVKQIRQLHKRVQ